MTHRGMTAARRAAVATALVAILLAPASAFAGDGEPPSSEVFERFVQALRPDAEAAGVTRATFDAAFAGVGPDASVAGMTRRQPEDLKSVGGYLDAQVTPARVATGRARLARWRDVLSAIEARYGVPPAIVVAVWGLETNYGAAPGSKDVVRSLATLGAMNVRPDLYRAELIAALGLLQRGDVARDRLRGSWAGAMGQPQFMPSSFETYAVDGDGDGRRDIWSDVPDALASIANFLRRQGWHPDEAWGCEVKLPPTLDLRRSRASYAEWASAGVVRADGRAMPTGGQGILLFPAGSGGPAFLVSENYEVLKTYNFSDVYVLSVGTLADRIDGGAPIATRWPAAPPLSRENRVALQALLASQGYPVDNRQGRISLALRDVIRTAQVRLDLVPDGNPTLVLLRALQRQPVGH